MNEGEPIIHHLQLMPAPGHWPGRVCICKPTEVEVEGLPCGHTVAVLVHLHPLTEDLVEKIKEDVRKYFKHGPGDDA